MKTVISLILLALIVSGCAPAAMSPSEYREQITRDYPKGYESYMVNRSVDKVASSFRRKAKECLNIEIETVSKGLNYGDKWTNSRSKSYVTNASNKSSLIMQTWMQGGAVKGPKDGYYMMVVDATPAGGNKTRIDAYSSLSEIYKQAVRSWANGNEQGCPDPMRMYDR